MEPKASEEVTALMERWARIGAVRDGARWIVPQRDADGNVVGKLGVFGSVAELIEGRHGICSVWPLDPYAGTSDRHPLYVVDNPADVVAGLSLGIDAIAIPYRGFDFPANKQIFEDRVVRVVVADSDRGSDGPSVVEKLELLRYCQEVGQTPTPMGFATLEAWVRAGCKKEDLDVQTEQAAIWMEDNSVAPHEAHAREIEFSIVPIGELGPAEEPDWVWPGYIARGAITLFTGLWKAGKTTLLVHLLRDLYRGGGLVECATDAPSLLVSEEPTGLWAERREVMNLPDAVLFFQRQSFARPDRAGWRRMVTRIVEEVRGRGIGLVVLDTLPSAWHVANENDAGEVLEALAPLRDISAAGAALLLTHHPRKSDGGEATATRGSGAVPGFVDIIVELRRASPEDESDRRRTLRAYGRYNVPPEVVIELVPGTGYKVLGDKAAVRDRDFHSALARLIPSARDWSAEDFREQWPEGVKPGIHRLRGHLNQSHRDGKCTRTGRGVRGDPFRYTGRPVDSIPQESPPGGNPESHPPDGSTPDAWDAWIPPV